LAQNTLVFFTSDNGPWLTQGPAGGSAGLLRDGKGSTWEGGMREPGIAWWPGRIKAASVSHELACTMDLFNTYLKLAGAPIPSDRVMDGLDLTPVLFGTGPSQRHVFFYYRGTQLYAARKGLFKAHFITRPSYGQDGPVTHNPPLLFHLGHDPSEKFNIASSHPDVLADIGKEVKLHQARVRPFPSQLEETIK
jgi:arylsulfatase A-like enzyme